MAGIPQVCVAYPEYVNINEEFEVALLVNDIKPETLSNALNTLLTNSVLYNKLKENTLKAREVLNWQTEEKKLIQFWTNIFT
jgi:glycosyltransferase involved in cell wall biosynthesis